MSTRFDSRLGNLSFGSERPSLTVQWAGPNRRLTEVEVDDYIDERYSEMCRWAQDGRLDMVILYSFLREEMIRKRTNY